MKKILSIILLITHLASWTQAKASNVLNAKGVEICTVPLPITSSAVLNQAFLGIKHVYLKVDGKTYGIPFTMDKTYLGGNAFLYTEDVFRTKFKEEEKCYPIKRYANDDNNLFTQRMKCIANKMAVPSKILKAKSKWSQELSKERKDWVPLFQYHGLTNNCAAIAKYLVSCAGGKTNAQFNFFVGDEVEDNTPAQIAHILKDGYVNYEHSNYGVVCKLAQDECSEI